MKKSTRTLALLLVLMLLLSMLAACGSSSDDTEETTTEEVEEEEAAEEEEEEEVEEEAEEEAAEEEEAESEEEAEEAAEEEAAEEEEEPEATEAEPAVSSISYPIEGDVTITIWKPFESMMWSGLLESYYDMPMLSAMEEATGFTLEFTSVDDTNSTEQFNLMIASGDWCDLINLSSYTGGLGKAYEDELCYDLTPYLEEYMPDYYDALVRLQENYPNGYRQTITDNGEMLAVYSITDEYVQEQGLIFRADWAEEAGLSDLVTLDDLSTYMEYITATYSPAYGMTASTGGGVDGVTGAFGVYGFDASGESVDLGLYLEGDTVVSTLTADGYREYIEWFNEMYDLGAIKADFYSETQGPDWVNTYVAEDDVGMTFIRSDKISSITSSATTEGFELKPTTSIVKNEGDTYTFGDEQSVVSTGFSIMTTTEHLEECMWFMNWFYTDDGFILSNYGQEGYTFEYDEDGVVRFTELITDSGYSNAVQVKNIYGNMIFGCEKDADCFYYTYADIEQEAMDIWSEVSDSSILPSFELGTEDSSTYAYIASDICTYAATEVMKWLIGTEELTDEAWNEYVEHCESLGLSEAVAMYQEAYDNFEHRGE